MSVKLLTEHLLEFLSLKGGWTGLSESTLVKIGHCWKSYVPAQLFSVFHFIMPYYKAGALYYSHHFTDVQDEEFSSISLA